ncbi:hypothetical protein M9Y10_008169 [Tritrichomonas musculus]|uniref:SMP-LTD domain-containing protein n=1 Tax=Tritrichomonas musculus TaxID=1915356 RepID=A0ABR2IXS3_9EUKA
MNVATTIGFFTSTIIILALFFYFKKHGFEFFCRFIKIERPAKVQDQETSIWINTLLSRFFTHIRDPKVAKQISQEFTFIPYTKSFNIVSVGSDIEFGKISNIPASTNSPQLIQVPMKWAGFSFDFQTTDGYMKFEIDVRQFESILSLSILEDGIHFRFVGDQKCDFDLSVIVWKKYTLTKCPIVGDMIRALLIYYTQKKDLVFPFSPLQKADTAPISQQIVV